MMQHTWTKMASERVFVLLFVLTTIATALDNKGLYDAEPILENSGDGSGGSGDEFSGSGYDGSGSGEEGSGICAMNMYSATCGPLCPQDCSNEITCQAITCTDEERCFCNSGYVLQNKDDPSLGCVLPEECPAAL